MLARLTLLACAGLALAGCDRNGGRAIQITGSSTVYPFTKAVADAFVKEDDGRKAPVIQSTGTGAGFKSFCGAGGADIIDASRRMRRDEFDQCATSKVGDIIEVPIGLDGVALAESVDGPKLALTRKDIYLALAANPMGKPNTAKTWKDVNGALPAVPIKVLGPPTSSGTRDAFVDLIMEPGCLEAYPEAAALKNAGDPAKLDVACRQIRSDGAFTAEGEDDRVIVTGLEKDPNALGLFGYSYLEEDSKRLRGIAIDGTAPSYAAIESGKYAGVRSLYLYVKKAQLTRVPGLPDFLALYAKMWEPGGPLAKHGLIAAPDRMRNRAATAIQNAEPLDKTALL